MTTDSLKFIVTDGKTWEKTREGFISPHFLQSRYWAELKSEYGWQPHFLIWNNMSGLTVATSMVLERTVKMLGLFPVTILYVPKGPEFNLLSKEVLEEILKDIISFSKKRKALFVKIDPNFVVGYEQLTDPERNLKLEWFALPGIFKEAGWVESASQIQFRNTFLLDIQKPAQDLLQEMKQKTRYNIKLSERKGVSVRAGTKKDFDLLYQLYAKTALRDGFVIRPKEYYFENWEKFFDAGLCQPLIAEFESETLAAVVIYFYGGTATYIYGMSSDQHRNLMPTYLLQWTAIQIAQEKGCGLYDFWGAPDEISEDDKLWGLYKFKIGFGRQFTRFAGAWDFVINKPGYLVYNKVLPMVLGIMRKIGFRKTREEIS